MARLFFVIDVKAATRFPSEIPRHNHFMLNRAWAKPRIFKKHSKSTPPHRKSAFSPKKTHNQKRTQRKFPRQSHNSIDGFNRRVPVPQYSQRLVVEGAGDTINDKAWSVFCPGRGFAHPAH